MLQVVALDVGVAVQANGNAVFKLVAPALPARHDVVSLHFRAAELVGEAAATSALDEGVLGSFRQESHGQIPR
jgi:hypothetical protein